MSSQANGFLSPCGRRKSQFTRATSSCCLNNGKDRVIDKSGDSRSRERGELQWEKLSDDEKNIYLAHKTACMVRTEHVILVYKDGCKIDKLPIRTYCNHFTRDNFLCV